LSAIKRSIQNLRDILIGADLSGPNPSVVIFERESLNLAASAWRGIPRHQKKKFSREGKCHLDGFIHETTIAIKWMSCSRVYFPHQEVVTGDKESMLGT
jgi:hypothetical protein